MKLKHFRVKKTFFFLLALALTSLSGIAKEVTVGKLKYKVNVTDKIARCTGLASPATKNYNLTIPSTINYGDAVLRVISVESDAFSGDYYLKNLTLSDYTETIGTMAFYSCSQLSSVSLGNSLKTIGKQAFQHGGTLGTFTTIKFPATLETIREEAFADCRYLTSVTLNRGLRTLERCAFWGCDGLKSITLPGSLRIIGDEAFVCCDHLEEVIFTSGDGNGKIGEKCFDNLKQLKRVSFLGPGIETIGRTAFLNCDIEWLSLPSSLRTVEFGAFYSNRLTSLVIPEGVVTIETYAFTAQKSGAVQHLILPSTLKTIGDYAFNGLSSGLPADIPTVTCHALVPPACGIEVFSQKTLDSAQLNVPVASLLQYRAAAVWKDFKWLQQAGIDDIDADNDDSTNPDYRYFNLHGLEIDKDNLTPGVYIRFRGDKSEKIVIR